MNSEKYPLLVPILIVLGLLLSLPTGRLHHATAQTPPDSNDVIFLMNLPEDQAARFSTFITTLDEVLTADGFSTSTRTGAPDDHALLGYSVTIEITTTESEALRLNILPRPPQDSVFSPLLESGLAVITLEAANTPPQVAAISQLVRTLIGYSQGACDSINMAALRTHPPEGIVNPLPLDYFTARCHYQARDYTAATAILNASLETLARDGWYGFLWRAAIAQAEAQNFQFDTALAMDNQLIQELAIELRSCEPPPATDALMADLYLLRGQHRLYLYEWDTVMADYNRAIALAPEQSRAYYLRGLLDYTQNNRQAALDDLTRFIQQETRQPTQHPATLALAHTYRAELETLLATPIAD